MSDINNEIDNELSESSDLDSPERVEPVKPKKAKVNKLIAV
jgi:hypothetical protein